MFLNPEYAALFILPVLILLFSFLGRSIRFSAYREMTGKIQLNSLSPGTLIILPAVVLIVLSLMRPVSHPEEQEIEMEGRNIVFLVDVSRSMLAEDLIPDRLDRTRFDLQAALPFLAGHRVALVAFAGDTVLKCPLTTDYTFFYQAVSDLSTRSVTKGGSSIGDALRFVINDLFPDETDMMDIILITDGEDQETYPVEAACKAKDKGIRIISIAMGNEKDATPIPAAGEAEGSEFLTYNNEIVLSYPDIQTLAEVAEASRGGWMINVSAGSIDFDRILREMSGPREETGSFKHVTYTEYYQWFLLPALILLLSGLYYRKIYG